MLYQLPNGRVIEISTEQYCELTDEELEYLVAYNFGDVQENPWFGSVLTKSSPPDIEELPPDLLNIDSNHKLNDLDVDKDLLNE